MIRGPEGGPESINVEVEQRPDQGDENEEVSIHKQVLQRMDEFRRQALRTTARGGVEIGGRVHEGLTVNISFIVHEGKIVDIEGRNVALKKGDEMYRAVFEIGRSDLTLLEITKDIGLTGGERIFSQAEIDRGFDDIYQEIDRLGKVESSSGIFSAGELKGIIRKVRKGELTIDYLPRANDYRKRVWELMKRSRGEGE